MSDAYKVIGKKITEFRKLKNLHVEDIAEKLGTTRQCVYQWEIAKNRISIEKLIDICNVYNVDINFFLGDLLVNPDSYKEQYTSIINEIHKLLKLTNLR